MEEPNMPSEEEIVPPQSPEPEETSPETKPPKRKIETGLLLGIIALLINIITVTIYISQTSIMRSQQRASAWPRLEWEIGYIQDEEFALEVTNNGIGPALIKSIAIKLDGETLDHLDSTYTRLMGGKNFPHLSNPLENRVIPPGKTIRPLEIGDPILASNFFFTLQQHQLEYSICYESVYGEQWTCNGLTVEKGKCF
ncbi:hypothetical protein [Flavilitoribacter nigricans]|uniref:Uncharacterized protein n=1 Tax=Flavilitoribacter nigricans (strain ATCC 23147 / DSM 23189 / NBRC 102662 / NCIMB 1420 / SS-2) TaxID=1122177 RepID=A0A2D0N8R7_FLAN2|nr:hypothetical protein [Flavilitoribacter nigricans]PHN04865.1 hypothetical protein CRP01_20375 [Flavilitoribacter nigricans DSM 23189 = NBRC 102662]